MSTARFCVSFFIQHPPERGEDTLRTGVMAAGEDRFFHSDALFPEDGRRFRRARPDGSEQGMARLRFLSPETEEAPPRPAGMRPEPVREAGVPERTGERGARGERIRSAGRPEREEPAERRAEDGAAIRRGPGGGFRFRQHLLQEEGEKFLRPAAERMTAASYPAPSPCRRRR